MSRDYSSWNRAVRELQQLSTKKTGEEIVGEAVRGFIREVVNVTPPAKGRADGAAKKAGENTIENDLRKLATPVAGVSGGKARDAMATAGDLRAAWADARKGQSSGRVNPATRKKLLVSKGDFNRVLREIQKQVGILAAGWNAAANRFGARLPAWIKRHGTRGGRVAVQHSNGRIRIIIENSVPYVDKVKALKSRVDFALKKQTGKMERKAQEIARRLARRAGLKVT